MILSNTEILNALRQGRLVIDPKPEPESPQNGPKTVDCPYNASSVDLRLGDEIAWMEPFAASVDLRQHNFNSLFGPNSKNSKLTDQTPFVLKPNHFVLAKTYERVGFPILADKAPLAARVEGKSSFARCGLLIHFTAPTIHSGFEGTITLELINLGPLSIELYPKMYICQLIIEEVSGTPFRNDSQFQGQTKPGGR